MVASKEMIQPSVFGQAIIITVYVPLLTFTGVEGKMFEPMAMTVIFALVAAFILSLTFVPAMIAIFVTGKVEEKENFAHPRCQAPVRAGAPRRSARHRLRHLERRGALRAVALFCSRASARSSSRRWMRKTSRCTPCASRQHVAHAVDRDAARRSSEPSRSSRSGVRLLQDRHRRNGVRSDAAERLGTFIILKPQCGMARSRRSLKAELIDKIEEAVEQLPGNNYEYTQPIQMRFNELIAGVRSDVAVKVYRRRLRPACAIPPTRSHPCCARPRRCRCEGRADDGLADAGRQARTRRRSRATA